MKMGRKKMRYINVLIGCTSTCVDYLLVISVRATERIVGVCTADDIDFRLHFDDNPDVILAFVLQMTSSMIKRR